jgi:hypothetical protein
MNARAKARAAQLRRMPDDIFAREATRRGFERMNGKTFVLTSSLRESAMQLEVVTDFMMDGLHEMTQLRTVRKVARALRGWLDLSEQLDPTRRKDEAAE